MTTTNTRSEGKKDRIVPVHKFCKKEECKEDKN